MRVGDIFTEALRAISGNKVRSGLTVLGIVIGIASVIALLALGQGSTNSITSSIESSGANLITVSPGFSRTAGPVFGGRGSAKTLTVKDLDAISTGVSNITAIAPVVSGNYQVVASQGNTNTQVLGTVSAYADVHKVTMSEGSFISDSDNQSESKVCVLGSQTATDLFGDPTSGGVDPIGQTVKIKSTRFTVEGVAASKGGSGFNNPDDYIYVPMKTAQVLLAGQTTYVQSIGIECSSQNAMTQVETDVTNLLLSRHNISDSSSADFSVTNQSDLASSLSSSTRTLTLLLAAVAGISLIVGGIGIMNMMLTTVTERTREIGLRKAIGAKRRDISIQFLVEAVLLTFASGILGIFIGWAVAAGLTRFAGYSSQVTWFAVVLAFGVSAVIGIVFGYYPARRAAGLNPIEALRYE
jgi:putative ABC transport system permease protein